MQRFSHSFMLRVTITFFIEYTISRNKFIQHFPKAMSAVVQSAQPSENKEKTSCAFLALCSWKSVDMRPINVVCSFASFLKTAFFLPQGPGAQSRKNSTLSNQR